MATIHSSSIAQAIDRIVSFFPVESQKYILSRLSLILKGIIVQELFPSLTGDKALIPAVEVLLVNDTGKKIIRDGDWKQLPDYILRRKPLEMQTMKKSVEDLANKGIIDIGYLKKPS
ncbi:MAG: hypothetical protein HQL22_12595 [Candidatus Omnitrophica bacterium]|nr:hypothetical protein [Candidatus Omnitrophota bacterium]